MSKNKKKLLIVLASFNLLLTPAVQASQDAPTFFAHVGSLVRGDFILAQFVSPARLDLETDPLVTIGDSAILAPLEPAVGPVLSAWGRVVVTAYSSSYDETDDTPYVTAAGTATRDGVIAANFLPFGTRVQLPELFGEKTFIVEDRMHYRYPTGRVDVWMPSKWEAKEFGKNFTELVIVEEI